MDGKESNDARKIERVLEGLRYVYEAWSIVSGNAICDGFVRDKEYEVPKIKQDSRSLFLSKSWLDCLSQPC